MGVSFRQFAVIVLWLAGGLGTCGAMAAPGPPLARDGVLDLRDWNAERDGPLNLSGTWRLNWGRFDDPAAPAAGATPVPVPGPWNAVAPGADGHATYTLTVLCRDAGPLAVLVPSQHSAMHLYVNGRLLVRHGRPAASPDAAEPRLGTELASLGDARCPLNVVAHVSNFDHRHGGMVRGIRIGAEAQLTRQRERGLATDIALMSGLSVMGVLPILFFAIRRRDTTSLWFGLFYLLLAVYIGFSGQRPLQHLALDLSWAAYLRFEYLGWYLAGPCFLLFARQLFPTEFTRRAVAGLIAAAALPALFVLFGPSRLYSYTVPWMQATTIVTALYAVAATSLAAWRRRPGAAVFASGIAVLAVSVVLGIAQYNVSLQSTAVPFGVVAFLFAPAFVLAQRFARALSVEELRAVEQRHRVNLLVRATKAGILDWDAPSNTLTYSDRYKEMLGHRADADTTGWPDFFEQVHDDDREAVRALFLSHLRDRSVRAGHRAHEPWQCRMRCADGSHRWVHAEALSLTGSDGRTLRYICSLIDITQSRETASRLEQQNETLKENVRLREEVERIARHDLKTPLNSILAVPRLLREQHRLQPDDEELLGIVERAGYRILDMVNLSLDLHKMEQGSYRFRPRAVDLLDVVKTVTTDVRGHAATKGLSLQVLLDGREPGTQERCYAWGEELLCYSILANLLKNAVEAAPEQSEITIALRTGESVYLRIHNEGSVPAPIRERFFDKYATAGKSSGTGLGTYSARLMSRTQQGDLSMLTDAAAGTTLVLRLRSVPPGHVPESRDAETLVEASSDARASELPAARVLVVDDDEYNLLVMRRYLPSPPLQVSTAVNGRAALDAAAAHAPHLILMDLEMPVMDGFEATFRLRERERSAKTARRCAIVALSSHDDARTQADAEDAGCDLYVTKPITKEALLDIVRRFVQPDAGDTEPAPPAAPLVAPPPTDAVCVDADLRDIVPSFLASRRTLLAALAEAAERGDSLQVRQQAHLLAGSFALYGFHWAAEQCRRIVRDGAQLDSPSVHESIAALRQHVDGVAIRYAEPLE